MIKYISSFRNGLTQSLLPSTGFILLFVLWFFVSNLKVVDTFFLPPIQEVIEELALLFTKEHGLVHTIYSLYRCLLSLLIASVLAIPLGLFIGFNKQLYQTLEMLIDFFRSLPATSLFPLFLLLFGVGDQTKIAIASFSVFWILLINSIFAAKNCSINRINVARIYKANHTDIFSKVVFFETLPNIFTGIRISLSLSLILIIVSEMFIGTKYGLGAVIYESYVNYDTTKLYSTLLTIGFVGYFLNKSLLFIEKRKIHWSSK